MLIFSDLSVGEQHGYSYDGWDRADPGLFHYTGEGQQGNQQLKAGNKAILRHAEEARALRVFEGARGYVRYLGEFRLADPPYDMSPAHASGTTTVRSVVVFHMRAIDLSGSHASKLVEPPRGGYIRPTWRPSKQPEPWSRDPNVLDRSRKAHIDTQNDLRDFLEAAGARAWSPQTGEPDHDLAWRRRGVTFVAEVKSLPSAGTEDRQMRLGIGQVLDYHALMSKRYPRVRAVLAVEREPASGRWHPLCASHGITLVWPATFDALLQ
ncbi:MAG: hypothetical protein K5924_08765 [Chloroflexi bacterium]|nr:hypothetical protein [Chloroflexota bacterium]